MFERKCMKCGTEVTKEAVFCPECGVNMAEYNKENARAIILGKKGYIADKNHEKYLSKKPEISTGTKIWLILLCIFILPLGLIAVLIVYHNHNKKVAEWQGEKIITNLEV